MVIMHGLFILLLICEVSNAVPNVFAEPVTSSPFVCFIDVCNLNTSNQFCDLRYRRCKNCKDVSTDCFTDQMQANCTHFCHGVEADKHIEELRVKDCPALSRIDHGDYNVTGPVGHDAIVGVNCHNGYRINGSARLKCSDFGSWNGVQPSCQAITCRRISEPHQGTSNVSGSQSFHIGDMVELHCNANYKLVGESIITCTETGEWSSGVPFCEEIKCWELLPVLDGSWIYNETGPARPGTRAVLKCDNVLDNIIGHALICTQNGTWVSEVMARSKQPNLDLSNYMPFCAPKKDGRNVVSRVLLIIGCIGSSLVTAAAGLCVWVTALRCKRKSVNLSSSSLDKGTNDEQIALINGENTLPKFIETNEQHNSRNNRMLRNANENGIQVIQVVNHVRASCLQTDNREMQTNVILRVAMMIQTISAKEEMIATDADLIHLSIIFLRKKPMIKAMKKLTLKVQK